jgi:hypothetical protein
MVMILIRYACGCIPAPHPDDLDPDSVNVSIDAAMAARFVPVAILCRICTILTDRSCDQRVSFFERPAVEDGAVEKPQEMEVDEKEPDVVGLEGEMAWAQDEEVEEEEKDVNEESDERGRKKKKSVKAWSKGIVRRSKSALRRSAKAGRSNA